MGATCLKRNRMNASARPFYPARRRAIGQFGPRIVLVVLTVLAVVLLLLRLVEFSRHGWRRRAVRTAPAALSTAAADVSERASSRQPALTDRFGDGTPDFLRLSDPADQAAFRRWFTLIAEHQAARPKSEVPAEIADCASLLRYAYREALMQHDENWFITTGIEAQAPPGEIRAWNYPHTPLGAALFRIRPGRFEPADLKDGAFAQFADAKTLVERNAYLVSRDVRSAENGDLLFYLQFGQSSPWHSMIVVRNGGSADVVYHTGPDHGRPGEIRRVALPELFDHPQSEWRPLAANPNFLGVYRWNILRGTL